MLSFSTNTGYYPHFLNSSLPGVVESPHVSVSIYMMFMKKAVLEWSIPATWGNCKFEVYVSETETENFSKLTNAPIDTFFFEDNSFQEFSKFHNVFYKVLCVLPDGRRVSSPTITWENTRGTLAEIRASEVTRREYVLLSKFTGIKSLLFRKKFFGQRCSRCWDVRLEKVMEDKCPVCVGTGFEGGYFPGKELFIQYEPTPNRAQLAYSGIIEQNSIPAWTINYPVVETFDIILRLPDYRIYRVDAVDQTELQTKTVRQLMQLTELAKISVEYELVKQVIPSQYL